MLGVPVDTWYVFLAVSIASTAIAGVGTQLTASHAPSAASVAATIDEVAASPAPTTGRHPLGADRIELGTRTLTIAYGDRTDQARYRFGPVVPIEADQRLQTVLAGAPPQHVFNSQAAFNETLATARARAPVETSVDGSVRVRTVAWNDTTVTLVGA